MHIRKIRTAIANMKPRVMMHKNTDDKRGIDK